MGSWITRGLPVATFDALASVDESLQSWGGIVPKYAKEAPKNSPPSSPNLLLVHALLYYNGWLFQLIFAINIIENLILNSSYSEILGTLKLSLGLRSLKSSKPLAT